MASAPELRIGTSGWHYPHWVGSFYPSGIHDDELLPHYARFFDSVEINNTFYRLPTPDAVSHWKEQTPSGFRFACKASRLITHMKKLKDPEEITARFFEAISLLEPKLGPVLFQLPPRWRVNAARLGAFLETLPVAYRYAFEFRDPSWFDAAIYELLRNFRIGFCIYDLAGMRSPIETTTDFVYVRLHGPAGVYRGCYSARAISSWARRLKGFRDEGKAVYCYFDNDEKGYAAKNALRLRELVSH